MNKRIYTQNKILVGVFIGGVIAGAYYFWRTFTELGRLRYRWMIPVVAVVLLGVTLGSMFVPTLDRIPNVAFWGLQIGLAYGVIRGVLLEDLMAHAAANKPEYGWGNTLLVAVLSMIITVGPMVALILWNPALLDQSTTRHYGKLQHEIMFDPASVSEEEVDRLASALTSAEYFDDVQRKTTDAAKAGDRFVITVYCAESARDPEVIDIYRAIREDVQKEFPANPIVIDMVVGAPDNRIARLE